MKWIIISTLALTLGLNATHSSAAQTDEAWFAGGCFWCVEAAFEKHDGVVDAVSGYTGGNTPHPDYSRVSSGQTQHYEAVKVIYKPSIISYSELLEIFWRQVNPTDAGGQFADRGPQYRTAIFYKNEDQKKMAQASLEALNDSGRYTEAIVTPIIKTKTFYDAEEYHQNYYKKHPIKYQVYRYGSGRDRYLKKIWGSTDIKD